MLLEPQKSTTYSNGTNEKIMCNVFKFGGDIAGRQIGL